MEYDIELVTPLFVGGAGGAVGGQEEAGMEGLRPPGVRHLIRFWYRCLLAGCSPHPASSPSDLGKKFVLSLRDAEWSLLGGPSRPSAVRLRSRLLDARVPADKYGVSMNKRGLPRVGISPATRALAKVTLQVAPSRQAELEAVWRVALALGGVGGRTRRGFGSLRSSSDTDPNPPGQDWLSAWARHYGTLINTARQHVPHIRPVVTRNATPLLPALCQECCRIWLVAPENGWGTWEAAMGGLRALLTAYARGHGREQGQSRAIGRPYGGGEAEPSPLMIQIKRTGGQNPRHFGVILAWTDALTWEATRSTYFTEPKPPRNGRGAPQFNWNALSSFLSEFASAERLLLGQVSLDSWSAGGQP